MAYAEAGSIAKTDRPVSRIENDVEFVKRLTVTVENTTNRIIGHARALGYFEPPQDTKASAPTPVVTTMADALRTLDHAIDHLSGSLNVFD